MHVQKATMQINRGVGVENESMCASSNRIKAALARVEDTNLKDRDQNNEYGS